MDPRWFVAHTKPRCEKKFAALLSAEAFEHELPLVTRLRHYARETKRSTKPLFPGYVFVHLDPTLKSRCYQQDLVVRLIEVDDETLFLRQLEDVRRIVASGLELSLHPLLHRGTRVRVTDGPLYGLEGVVDDPKNPHGIVVSVDVLRQGLLIRLPLASLALLD